MPPTEPTLRLPATASPAAVLSAVVDLADDAVFSCEASGRVSSWGTTAVRLFGHSAAEAIGGSLTDLFPEHLRAEMLAVTARVVAGDRIHRFETEVLRGDGMPMPISLSMAPILDANRALVAIVVIARDVTEQRVTQATLAEVEVRLRESEALAHVGSWMWDVRTGAVQWSGEFHEILGVDPLDFDGTFESHLGVIHADDRDPVRQAMEGAVGSGHAFEREYRIVTAGHEIRVIRVKAQPLMGSAGVAVGLRGIGQDVTGAPL